MMYVMMNMIFITVKPLSIISKGTTKNKRMQKTDSCGKVVYMGNKQAPEKANETCGTTMDVGTMDRCFAVLVLAVSFVT
jgi:hypothetical protein